MIGYMYGANLVGTRVASTMGREYLCVAWTHNEMGFLVCDLCLRAREHWLDDLMTEPVLSDWASCINQDTTQCFVLCTGSPS